MSYSTAKNERIKLAFSHIFSYVYSEKCNCKCPVIRTAEKKGIICAFCYKVIPCQACLDLGIINQSMLGSAKYDRCVCLEHSDFLNWD